MKYGYLLNVVEGYCHKGNCPVGCDHSVKIRTKEGRYIEIDECFTVETEEEERMTGLKKGALFLSEKGVVEEMVQNWERRMREDKELSI